MWNIIVAVFAFCAIGDAVRAHRPARDPVTLSVKESSSEPTYSWKTDWFDAPINNFAFTNAETYKMKYLYNDTYYKPGGPIFFYTGNEGAIEGFAENAGIMFDLAIKFNAALLFGEHRYYGASMPFGNLSYTNVTYLGYMTTTQALADYAKLIPYAKKNVFHCDPKTPVIAFGGSYGGMLAAWFRMKYPHIVAGSWASSAPMMYFKGGGVDWGAFYKVITDIFEQSGCNRNAIANGWDAIIRVGQTADGLTFLNNLFHIEEKSKLTFANETDDLVSFVREALDYMAMVNYPYPNSLLQPLPGWPVKKTCEIAGSEEPKDDKGLVQYMYKIANFYYNNTGQNPHFCVKYDVCGDVAISQLGSQMGWPWQECTELIIEMCSRDGKNDFYFDDCKEYGGPLKADLDFCAYEFTKIGWNPTFLWETAIPNEYGLKFGAASNIVFTNGGFDPWSAGGVYANTSGIKKASKNGVYTFFIPGSAHHLDLRQPNSCDPPPLTNARYQTVKIMECWVNPKSCPTMPVATELPPLGPEHSENCHSIINGFPWGQGGSGGSSTPEQPPTTTPEQPPTTTHEQPPTTTHEQPPTTTHEQPPTTTHEQPPTTTHEQPPTTTPEQPPITTPKQPPTTTTEEPTITITEEPPTTTTEEPTITITEEPPITITEEPPITTPEQPPITTPEQPPITTPEQPPITTPEQPSITTPEQPTTKAAPPTHLLNTFTILALSAALFVFRTL